MAIELTDEMMSKWPPDAQAVVRLLLARINTKPALRAAGSARKVAFPKEPD